MMLKWVQEDLAPALNTALRGLDKKREEHLNDIHFSNMGAPEILIHALAFTESSRSPVIRHLGLVEKITGILKSQNISMEIHSDFLLGLCYSQALMFVPDAYLPLHDPKLIKRHGFFTRIDDAWMGGSFATGYYRDQHQYVGPPFLAGPVMALNSEISHYVAQRVALEMGPDGLAYVMSQVNHELEDRLGVTVFLHAGPPDFLNDAQTYTTLAYRLGVQPEKGNGWTRGLESWLGNTDFSNSPSSTYYRGKEKLSHSDYLDAHRRDEFDTTPLRAALNGLVGVYMLSRTGYDGMLDNEDGRYDNGMFKIEDHLEAERVSADFTIRLSLIKEALDLEAAYKPFIAIYAFAYFINQVAKARDSRPAKAIEIINSINETMVKEWVLKESQLLNPRFLTNGLPLKQPKVIATFQKSA